MPFLEAAVYSDKGGKEQFTDNFCFKGQFLDIKAESQNIHFSHVHHEQAAFYGVFEGMAENEGGGKAAYLSAQAFIKAMPSNRTSDRILSEGDVRAIIRSAAIRANDSVQAQDGARLNKLGAHFAGLCFFQEKVMAAGLGDCRVYLLRDGTMRQVTSQSRGYLGAFGMDTALEPAFVSLDLKESDTFLICSGGTWNALTEAQMRDILSLSYSMREIAAMLIDQVLIKGSDEAATAVVIKVKSMGDENAAPKTRVPISTPVPTPPPVTNTSPIANSTRQSNEVIQPPQTAPTPIVEQAPREEQNRTVTPPTAVPRVDAQPTNARPADAQTENQQLQPQRQRLRSSRDVTPSPANLASPSFGTPRERAGTPPPSNNDRYESNNGGSHGGKWIAWLVAAVIVIVIFVMWILPGLSYLTSQWNSGGQNGNNIAPDPNSGVRNETPIINTRPEVTENISNSNSAPEPTPVRQPTQAPEPTQEPVIAPEPEEEQRYEPPITENEPVEPEVNEPVTPNELDLAPDPED